MSYPILYSAAQAFAASDKIRNNAGLVFDRFVPDLKSNDQAKRDALNAVIATRHDSALLKALAERWQALTHQADHFELNTDWRLVTGVGRNTPYEVGFAFDHYGFATLPGSSVKGIARAYGFWSIAKALGLKRSQNKHKNKPLESLVKLLETVSAANQDAYATAFRAADPIFKDISAANLLLIWRFHQIFGNTDLAGRAIFYDAIPLDDPKLVLDVMNPHYPKYYQGSEPPTNWQSPIPILFLTVDKGVRFGFAIGWQPAVPGDPAQADLRTLAKAWLWGGLTELGAGAKTSAGYGFFIENINQAANAASTATVNTAIGLVDNSNGQAGIAVLRADGTKIKVRLPSWRTVGFANDPPGKTPVEFEYVGELRTNTKVNLVRLATRKP